MKYSSRFFLYAPITLFLAFAACVMIHWWQVAGTFDRKLYNFKGHEAIPGVTLDWSKLTLSGFPFRIDAVFDGFKVTGAGAHGPFAWTSDRFALHVLTYGAAKDVFEATGNQTLSWTDAEGTAHSVRFLPGALRASAVRDTNGLARFDLDIINAGSARFTAGRLQLHLRRDPDGKSLDLMASADEMRAAEDIAFFGPHIRILRIYTNLTEGEAFVLLLAGRASPASADAAWRRAGGEARTSKLEVETSRLTTTVINSELQARFATLLAPLY